MPRDQFVEAASEKWKLEFLKSTNIYGWQILEDLLVNYPIRVHLKKSIRESKFFCLIGIL